MTLYKWLLQWSQTWSQCQRPPSLPVDGSELVFFYIVFQLLCFCEGVWPRRVSPYPMSKSHIWPAMTDSWPLSIGARLMSRPFFQTDCSIWDLCPSACFWWILTSAEQLRPPGCQGWGGSQSNHNWGRGFLVPVSGTFSYCWNSIWRLSRGSCWV